MERAARVCGGAVLSEDDRVGADLSGSLADCIATLFQLGRVQNAKRSVRGRLGWRGAGRARSLEVVWLIAASERMTSVSATTIVARERTLETCVVGAATLGSRVMQETNHAAAGSDVVSLATLK